MSRNLRGLSLRKGLTDSMYEKTSDAALSADDLRETNLISVARGFMTGNAAILSASSFYDFLDPEHQGKKVFVCNGTACLVSGRTEEVMRELLETYEPHEIGTMTCLGHCHSNDAWLADSEIHLCKCGEGRKIPEVYTNAEKPVLTAPAGDLKEYYSTMAVLNKNVEAALRELEASGLRGRGGAGFPFHIKVRAARDAATDGGKYIVCNGDEGDPGAFSDKWLLEERPHSVLFGMLATGIITGAGTGVVYIRGEYPLAIKKVREAIRTLEEMGIAAGDENHDKDLFRFHVVQGAGAYICGEETSLLNSIEGLRAEVRTRPPFPAVYGLFGKPTVLSNVETFANVRSILEKGGAAWAAMGTEKSTGTKLVSLDGAFNRPGLLEVKMGTPLRTVIDEMGGGTRYPVKAFQIGGPLGGLVPASRIGDLTLDFESFAREGFLLGHAGVVSIPDDFPVIKLIEHLFEFTRKESCGKCFPCRLGSARGHELVSGAVEHGEIIDRQLFDDLLEAMELGSLCALGSGLPLPVRNALQYFDDELKDYFISTKEPQL